MTKGQGTGVTKFRSLHRGLRCVEVRNISMFHCITKLGSDSIG